jgi:hypothetical protein
VLTLVKGEQGVESFITFTNRGGQETLRMQHFAEGRVVKCTVYQI